MEKNRVGRNLNIEMRQLPELSWKTPAETEQSINVLYRYAETRAQDVIDWYLRAKHTKALGSRSLRLSAILFTTLGGLSPIVVSIGWFVPAVNYQIAQAGYLMLGLAAACVGLDKFLGFSSGWMRYIKAALMLEKTLSEFRLDWAMINAKLGAKQPTVEQIQIILQRVKEFLLIIDTQVEHETQSWIKEFQSNLAEMERNVKAQVEESRPGVIDVVITNGLEAKNGFTVALDDMVLQTVHGTQYQTGYVSPGPHKITVTGTVGDKTVNASELVNVASGMVTQATLTLPVHSG